MKLSESKTEEEFLTMLSIQNLDSQENNKTNSLTLIFFTFNVSFKSLVNGIKPAQDLSKAQIKIKVLHSNILYIG